MSFSQALSRSATTPTSTSTTSPTSAVGHGQDHQHRDTAAAPGSTCSGEDDNNNDLYDDGSDTIMPSFLTLEETAGPSSSVASSSSLTRAHYHNQHQRHHRAVATAIATAAVSDGHGVAAAVAARQRQPLSASSSPLASSSSSTSPPTFTSSSSSLLSPHSPQQRQSQAQQLQQQQQQQQRPSRRHHSRNSSDEFDTGGDGHHGDTDGDDLDHHAMVGGENLNVRGTDHDRNNSTNRNNPSGDDHHDDHDHDDYESDKGHGTANKAKKRQISFLSSLYHRSWLTILPGNTMRLLPTLLVKYYPRFKALLFGISCKQVVSLIMFSIISIVIWESLFTAPEHRLLQPDFAATFLSWVQQHPIRGMLAIVVAIAIAVVVMIPIGTPLTLGCGYIYKSAYGWKLGLVIATAVSMSGSALGAIICFLLGRYLMRDHVRGWIRQYPLFDAIDVAAAEHGLRIMAMLYLTPILPLGPVSYMCGTTSMALRSFVLAKIASLPLMLLYVFIGASTGALLGGGGGGNIAGNNNNNNNNSISSSASGGDTQAEATANAAAAAAAVAAAAQVQSIEENEYLIVSGIVLSLVMIMGITHSIKKELNKILERQKKYKPGEKEDMESIGAATMEESTTENTGVAMTAPRQRRVGA